MRIGHYEPSTAVTLEDGRLSPTFMTEELRRVHGFPGMTDEDLFLLTFHEFSRSIKVALLDECPLTPQEAYDRGKAVYARAMDERTRQSRRRGKRRRAMKDYAELCETMYQDWVKDRSEVPEGFRLQKEFAPEPYLNFGGETLDGGSEPKLVFLTTNPGGGMRFQRKDEPETLATDEPYASVQAKLAAAYAKAHVPGLARTISVPATTRIKRMHEIAEELRRKGLVESTGFVQCEMIPFHSETLPNKQKLAKLLAAAPEDGVLGGYREALRAFLKANHVVALDAKRLTNEAEIWTDWVGMKADLFGFDPSKAGEPYEKKSENENPSVRFYGYVENGLIRAYNLTDAGNNFGKEVEKMVGKIVR